MNTLLRLSPCLILSAALAACGTISGPTAQVGVSPSLVGAAITTNLYVKRDAATGQLLGLRIQQESTQPTLRVAVAPSSLGVTFTRAEITVVDSAGITYNRTVSQSMGERVQSGYACKAEVGDTLPNPDLEQCEYALKVPYARTLDLASLSIIDATTSAQLADEFVSAYGGADACPNLSANVILYGFDDLNRSISPVVIKNAPIAETCNVFSES